MHHGVVFFTISRCLFISVFEIGNDVVYFILLCFFYYLLKCDQLEILTSEDFNFFEMQNSRISVS